MGPICREVAGGRRRNYTGQTGFDESHGEKNVTGMLDVDGLQLFLLSQCNLPWNCFNRQLLHFPYNLIQKMRPSPEQVHYFLQ